MNMQNMKSLLPLCLLTTLFFISCNDDDATPTVVTLPPITSEGLNTFGCMVNGEPWVAQVNNNIDDKLDVIFNPFNDELQLHAKLVTSNKDEQFNFGVLNVNEEKEYQIPGIDPNGIFWDWKNSKSYTLDTSKVRSLKLNTFNTTEKIVSGTFEFTVFRGNDTLKITEGQFDAKYRD